MAYWQLMLTKKPCVFREDAPRSFLSQFCLSKLRPTLTWGLARLSHVNRGKLLGLRGVIELGW